MKFLVNEKNLDNKINWEKYKTQKDVEIVKYY
jgi:hypothetical protein